MAYMQSWAHVCMRTGRQDMCWGHMAHRFMQCARAQAHEPTWRQLSTGRLTSCAMASGSSGRLPGSGLGGRRQACPCSAPFSSPHLDLSPRTAHVVPPASARPGAVRSRALPASARSHRRCQCALRCSQGSGWKFEPLLGEELDLRHITWRLPPELIPRLSASSGRSSDATEPPRDSADVGAGLAVGEGGGLARGATPGPPGGDRPRPARPDPAPT